MILAITVVLEGQSNFCYDPILIYEVVPEEGVNIRESKFIDSKIITSIPRNERVFVCRSFTGREKITVQGNTGYWFKCKYKSIEGYIFSSNLKQVECNLSNGQLITFPEDGGVDRTLDRMPISCNGDIGIFITDKNERLFETRKISVVDTVTNYSYLYFGKYEGEEKPLFVVHGESNIRGKGRFFIKPGMFHPGEGYEYKNPNTQEELFFSCTGIVEPGSKYGGIKEYSLQMHYGSNQVLTIVTFDLSPWYNTGYEGGIWLSWIGDIDGDGRAEVIVKTQSHYAGWAYYLIRWRNNTYEAVLAGSASSC